MRPSSEVPVWSPLENRAASTADLLITGFSFQVIANFRTPTPNADIHTYGERERETCTHKQANIPTRAQSCHTHNKAPRKSFVSSSGAPRTRLFYSNLKSAIFDNSHHVPDTLSRLSDRKILVYFFTVSSCCQRILTESPSPENT